MSYDITITEDQFEHIELCVRAAQHLYERNRADAEDHLATYGHSAYIGALRDTWTARIEMAKATLLVLHEQRLASLSKLRRDDDVKRANEIIATARAQTLASVRDLARRGRLA
jgi:hypothetical protein